MSLNNSGHRCFGKGNKVEQIGFQRHLLYLSYIVMTTCRNKGNELPTLMCGHVLPITCTVCEAAMVM